MANRLPWPIGRRFTLVSKNGGGPYGSGTIISYKTVCNIPVYKCKFDDTRIVSDLQDNKYWTMAIEKTINDRLHDLKQA